MLQNRQNLLVNCHIERFLTIFHVTAVLVYLAIYWQYMLFHAGNKSQSKIGNNNKIHVHTRKIRGGLRILFQDCNSI